MSDEQPFFPVSPEKLLEMNEVELQEYVASMANAFPESSYIPPPDPYFEALSDPLATADQIRQFLDAGADPNQTRKGHFGQIEHPLLLSAKNGNIEVVRLLIDRGGNVNFANNSNYSVILNACFMPREIDESRILKMVTLLLDHGVDSNQASDYGESPVRVSARAGNFEVVRLLLDRGASAAPLAWNELMHAVALGSIDDVTRAFDSYPDVELEDSSRCTALMLALKNGDVEKAKALIQYGANPNSIAATHEEPLHCAIQSGNRKMVDYFLSLKADYAPSGYEESGPVSAAVEAGNYEVIEFLIQSYVNDPLFQKYLDKALYNDEDGKFARLLLDSGANPDNIRRLARRTVLGHSKYGEEELEKISKEQYLEGRSPYFGLTNPELVNRPFWLAMIRIGYSGYGAREHFGEESNFVCGGKYPVWCAERYGQSITFLPDGRVIEIGGEHEDSYDPDFCIYNDVFVHYPDGKTDIYCYPKEVFPPTDFHSATLVGEWIYIVGCLGYHGERQGIHIPVFRLNINSLQIERVVTQNSPPSQVYSHLAKLIDGDKIQISGGKRLTIGKKKVFSSKPIEVLEPNINSYILDLATRKWYSTSVLSTN